MDNVNDDEIVIDLREVAYALKKRILIILAALLAGAVIAGVYTQAFVTPLYSSTATMLVIPKETAQTSLTDLQVGTQLTKDYSIMIASRSVLQEVIDNLGLDISCDALESAISVNNPEETRILEITVTYPDPETASRLVNELAKVASGFIGEQMDVDEPRIIEQGETATAPVSPNLGRNVMIGGLAGLVLSAGIVILLVVTDNTIKTEEDVERYLGLSTLASIPDRSDFISGKREKKKKHKRRKRR